MLILNLIPIRSANDKRERENRFYRFCGLDLRKGNPSVVCYIVLLKKCNENKKLRSKPK
jgi:hypothetical protein